MDHLQYRLFAHQKNAIFIVGSMMYPSNRCSIANCEITRGYMIINITGFIESAKIGFNHNQQTRSRGPRENKNEFVKILDQSLEVPPTAWAAASAPSDLRGWKSRSLLQCPPL